MVTPHLIPCHCMPSSSGGISGRCGAASRFWEAFALLSSDSHGRKESQGSGAVSDAIAESTIQAQRGHPETLGPKHASLGLKDLTVNSFASKQW